VLIIKLIQKITYSDRELESLLGFPNISKTPGMYVVPAAISLTSGSRVLSVAGIRLHHRQLHSKCTLVSTVPWTRPQYYLLFIFITLPPNMPRLFGILLYTHTWSTPTLCTSLLSIRAPLVGGITAWPAHSCHRDKA
jgi:hypothetical protein